MGFNSLPIQKWAFSEGMYFELKCDLFVQQFCAKVAVIECDVLLQALCGGSFFVPTIDGNRVQLRIEDEVITPKTTRRIPNQGKQHLVQDVPVLTSTLLSLLLHKMNSFKVLSVKIESVEAFEIIILANHSCIEAFN